NLVFTELSISIRSFGWELGLNPDRGKALTPFASMSAFIGRPLIVSIAKLRLSRNSWSRCQDRLERFVAGLTPIADDHFSLRQQ
ncbi:hypothetical protein, partial [Moorena sp. SIO1F2]|uniref:hypothetical protein n=1 Tax=Moorena sp. SIO1F2 TaxID=2607819 RepID=UPI0025E92C32